MALPMERKAKKILLIGWDAADWKIIQPLLDQGKMPALRNLMDRGVSGKIATLDPPYSPMLWTSVATGKTPDKHGILNFTEPAPKDGGIRPVLSTSRTSRTLWNIFTNQGLKSNVVSWWPSHPVEPINGVMVSDLFGKATANMDEPWPMRKGMVYPPELAGELGPLRIHPEEITPAHILPFIPKAEEIDQKEDKHLHNFVNILAHCSSLQATSTWLMQNKAWDFMGVYFDAIDHFCHGFIKFHPPKLPGMPQDKFDIYKEVVNGAYVFHDMMLERMLALAGDDTTVILMSDHGFYSDHLRLTNMPKFNAAPALEHRPYGILVMAGPGIAKGKSIFGASLLDIAPTILTLFGLPIGKDMDGKLLPEVFDTPPTPTYIDSWEKVDGDFGELPPEAKEDPVAAHEAMEQLVALGYIEAPGEDKTKAATNTKRDIRFNLAMVHKGKGEREKAVAILRELHQESPDELRFLLELSSLCLQANRTEEAREMIVKLREHPEKKAINLPLLESKLYLSENKPWKALQRLEEAESANVRSPNLYLEIGRICLVMHRFQRAEAAYEKALEKDPESAHAFQGLAVSLLRQGDYEGAAEQALNAIELLYFFPNAHYILGEALDKLELYPDAIGAYEVALRIAPGMIRAKKALAILYRKTNQIEKANALEEELKNLYKGTVIVISGLPHSGKERMHDLLKAGGLETTTFTASSEDAGTLPDDADGKMIVVDATALKRLPKHWLYKVIFMKKTMVTLLREHQKSIGQSPNVFPAREADAYKRELERVAVWQEKEPHVAFFPTEEDELIEHPEVYLNMLDDFLKVPLQREPMMEALGAKNKA